jgi:restriction system protein
MAKKNDVSAKRKTAFEFPVLGIILSLFVFVLGHYLERKGLPSDLSGGQAVYLADYVFYGECGYILSGILFLISTSFYLWNSIRKKNEIFPDAKKSLSDLQELSWREFEEYIWTLFSKLGFSMNGNGDNEPIDAGADLILKRDGRISVVRSRKYYIRRVPLAMVREFFMVLQTEPSLEKGYFITTGFFSPEARIFAAGKPIELIDGERLMDFVRIADSIDSVQERSFMHHSLLQAGSICPRCGASLAERTDECDNSSMHIFRECSMSTVCEGALRKE